MIPGISSRLYKLALGFYICLGQTDKGHAVKLQQPYPFCVVSGAGRDGDLQPPYSVYLIVVNLWEYYLLPDPDGKIASSIKTTL